MWGMLAGDILGAPFNGGKKMNSAKLIKFASLLMVGENAYTLDKTLSVQRRRMGFHLRQ
jgi:hypothetical protein